MNVFSIRPVARRLALLIVAGGFVAAALLTDRAIAAEASLVGRKIEGFELKDFRGRARSLQDWSDAKLVVIAFVGTECPLANLYQPKLAELAKKFEAKGVAFVGINSNYQDSITEVGAHAQRHNIPFPVLK